MIVLSVYGRTASTKGIEHRANAATMSMPLLMWFKHNGNRVKRIYTKMVCYYNRILGNKKEKEGTVIHHFKRTHNSPFAALRDNK